MSTWIVIMNGNQISKKFYEEPIEIRNDDLLWKKFFDTVPPSSKQHFTRFKFQISGYDKYSFDLFISPNSKTQEIVFLESDVKPKITMVNIEDANSQMQNLYKVLKQYKKKNETCWCYKKRYDRHFRNICCSTCHWTWNDL